MSDQLSALPLSATLKALTQPQHDEAEKHPLHAVLFGSNGPTAARDAYTRLLGQHLRIQETFEPLLREAAEQTYTYRAMVRPHHFHLAALRDDLDALGVENSKRTPLPATARFVSFIESCAPRAASQAAPAHDGCLLLGVWYVFEGSTNGGTIIGKKMRELLALEGETGTQFINPHGPLVRSRWSEWKQTLDSMTFDVTHREGIIAAAQEAFNLSRAVLDDVHAEMVSVQTSPQEVIVVTNKEYC